MEQLTSNPESEIRGDSTFFLLFVFLVCPRIFDGFGKDTSKSITVRLFIGWPKKDDTTFVNIRFVCRCSWMNIS